MMGEYLIKMQIVRGSSNAYKLYGNENYGVLREHRRVGIGEMGKAYRMLMNAVFWDVTPCGSCNNRRFGGMHRLRLRSLLQLLVNANAVPSSLILSI
jgi:hypothetical protein